MPLKRASIRRFTRLIHLWSGFAAGLVLAIIGVTGSLYVFQPEISAFFQSEVLTPATDDRLFADDVAIARHIEQSTGKQIESLQWPMRERATYMFKLFGDPEWYYLDPSTGNIRQQADFWSARFFRWIVDVHTSLTVGDVGYFITASMSLLLAVIILSSGLYLWWPHNKARRKSSFTIRRKASPQRRNYDLHNVVGFYASLPLFILAITGAYFHYDKPIQQVVDWITFSPSANQENPWEAMASVYQPGRPPLNIQQVLHLSDTLYPQLHRRNLWMTADSTGYVTTSFQREAAIHPGADFRVFVFLDRYTGQVLHDTNPALLPRGSRLMEQWLFPLHFGEFGGWPTRLLWFLIGLTPAWFFYSGWKIWYHRHHRKAGRRRVPAKGFSRSQATTAPTR